MLWNDLGSALDLLPVVTKRVRELNNIRINLKPKQLHD